MQLSISTSLLHINNQHASLILKGYLRYKAITSQNVPSKAQIKIFFIS